MFKLLGVCHAPSFFRFTKGIGHFVPNNLSYFNHGNFVPKTLSYPRFFRTRDSFVPEITTSTYCIKEVLIISIVL